MKNVEQNKHNKIDNILSAVKLSSLLFSGIILCKSMFKNQTSAIDEVYKYYNNITILFPIVMLIGIYCMWTFSNRDGFKTKYNKSIILIEQMIFIILFTVIIYFCGAHESQYKFLYLFIITTSTIESGMKQGIIVASISSGIILGMDLLAGTSGTVNAQFENDLILAGIFILTAWPLGHYVQVANDHIGKLENMVNLDGLTNVYNHRYFHEVLGEKIKIGERQKRPVSLIFIDIDYFKHYNDLNGHQKGDQVLKLLAKILYSNIREKDIVARYGGEEFAIILPNTDEEQAIKIAERLREKIEITYFEGEENQPNGKITASMGISVYPEKAKNDVELIKSADDALYRAKFFNKNRVETYTSILDEIKRDIEEEHIDLVASIKTLISVINAKDRYTYGHVERVVFYSRLIAEKLQLDEVQKKNLIYGAYMHDIGKINIAKDILIKKMKLTNDEWEMLKQHPANGVEIIEPVKTLNDIKPLIMHHHERYDGRGYPDGLKGGEIPYLARILTVVDSFDAMTSNRPYNVRKTYNEAIEELVKCSGTQFDPNIAEVFIEVIKENRCDFDNIS